MKLIVLFTLIASATALTHPWAGTPPPPPLQRTSRYADPNAQQTNVEQQESVKSILNRMGQNFAETRARQKNKEKQ